MTTLDDQMAKADKFTIPPHQQMPVVDRSAQAAFGLDWASRQSAAPKEEAAPQPKLGAYPIPN